MRWPSVTCWDREFADSPLEESGFEPLVPLTLNPTNAGERDEVMAETGLSTFGKIASLSGKIGRV
jgi:hypothetical protein